MACTATAAGARSWLDARRFSWLTPRRMQRVAIGLVVAMLVASGSLISGSG